MLVSYLSPIMQGSLLSFSVALVLLSRIVDSFSVAEREIDYTNCLVYPTTDKKIFAWELLNKTDRGSAEPIKCRIQFNLTENFEVSLSLKNTFIFS